MNGTTSVTSDLLRVSVAGYRMVWMCITQHNRISFVVLRVRIFLQRFCVAARPMSTMWFCQKIPFSDTDDDRWQRQRQPLNNNNEMKYTQKDLLFAYVSVYVCVAVAVATTVLKTNERTNQAVGKEWVTNRKTQKAKWNCRRYIYLYFGMAWLM